MPAPEIKNKVKIKKLWEIFYAEVLKYALFPKFQNFTL
jgi:hypothetical protein